MPNRYIDFKTLENADYKPLVEISRCMHFDDVEQTYDKQLLQSYKIDDKCVENKEKYLKNKKVWWFAPAKDPEESHFYGNVSYEIEWSKLLEKFGPNIYEIDTLSLSPKVASRILITDANHDDFLTKITEEKLHKDEIRKQNDCYPIMKEGDTYHYAKVGDGKRHFLEIAVEDTGKDGGEWLFEKCTAKANDHSEVNEPYDGPWESDSKFNSYQCLRFNTNGKVECKFDFNLEEAEEKLGNMDFSIRK